ncbi:DUF7261 family protein [Halorientalis pallida]|uniref:Uncharacterized protein n=1 Tax=Halorientalis pallida TaxID=2479928 RepID=A0A498L286_9EURY|nr:hypothetical protein [Halorientalis pallida]RXK49471.1 hypothetical protein EAF64_11220 [Halorientalis pallida]
MVSLTLPDDERGQLLLVGAATIALVIVGSVILLNGLKFTDTVGTEGNFDSTDEAQRTAEMVRQDLSKMADRVRSKTGLTGFETAMRQSISIYSNRLSNMTFADSATYVNVSLDVSASRGGPLVTQNLTSTPSSDEDFRNPGWGSLQTYEVARGASTVGPFNFTVTQFPCDRNTSPPDTNFTVTVENTSSGNVWQMRLTRDTDGAACPSVQGTRYIEVYDESGTKLQSWSSDSQSWFPGVGDGPVTIDLINETISDKTVPLDFAEGVDPEYLITFDNNFGGGPDTFGEGSYWVGSDGSFPTPGDDGSGNPPNVRTQIQRPAFEFVYERPGVRYNTTMLEGGGA